MFSSFKKDIITKKLTKEKNIIINKSKVDNNDSLAIHKNLEKLISEFYDKKFYKKSGLTYNDLINRRNRITKYTSTSKDIGISFLFGAVGSLFISAIFDMTNLLNGTDAFFSGIFMMLFILLIDFGVLYLIMYFTKVFSDTDKYHINNFELSKIDELIAEYERSK